MSTLKYAAYGSSVALFANTELASMVNGQGCFGAGGGLSSNLFDNTVNLYPEADIEVALGSLTPTSGGYVYVAFLWGPDGTNFPDPQFATGQSANNAAVSGTPIFSTGLTTSTGAKKLLIPNVKLRPAKGYVLFWNQSGATLNASGNSVTLFPTTFTML